MTFIDSLLTLLKERREIAKEKRQQIVGFIRKIADCCSSFSQSCHKLRSVEDYEIFSAESDNLYHQVDLVEGYLEQLDVVLKGKVKSETLDELSIILSRIVIVEVPVVNFGRVVNMMYHQAIKARFEEAWKEYPVYSVTFLFPHDYIIGSRHQRVSIHCAGFLDNYREVLRDSPDEGEPTDYPGFPTVDEFLAQLSALRAKLVVLADAIEAGATL